MRKDVRAKEEWLNPCGRQLRACREANIKLWRANNRRLSPVLITTRRDQRDRADVVTTIRVTVNASVQSRRDADEKCPGKRRKEYGSQQEYAREFVNALSCSSASERLTMAGFAQVIFWRARSLPSNSCLGALLIFGFRVRVPLSFGTQHHDWPGTFSRRRGRGPSPPIWCSRSMGPDPTGPGSNGDVQNDASTQESFRAQTAVLSP